MPKFDINKNIPDMKNEMNKKAMNHIDVKIEIKTPEKKSVASKMESKQSPTGSPTKTQKIKMPPNGTNKMLPMTNVSMGNNMSHMPNGINGNKMPQIPNGMAAMMKKIPMPSSMMKNGNMENSPCDMLSKFIMSTDAFSCSCASAVVRAFDLSPHREAVDLGGMYTYIISMTICKQSITNLFTTPYIYSKLC